MTLAAEKSTDRTVLETWPSHAIRVQKLEELVAIHRPELNFVACPSQPPSFLCSLAELALATHPEFQAVIGTSDDPALFLASFDEQFNLQSKDSGRFYAYLERMLRAFFVVANASPGQPIPYVGIRFEVLRQDLFVNYHVDHVHLRMVTVLSGPGTEWLANDQVIRTDLRGAEHPLGASVEIGLKPEAKALTLATGDVAILKGEAYPGNCGNGIVHRAPHHHVLHQPRILLRFDALVDVT
jgi:hypothetical protein